jgi:CRISPR-associated protein Cas1
MDGPAEPQAGSSPDPVLVPARMLNEVVYCPRLAVLEWVQGEFAPSVDTEEGLRVHRRVDTPRRSGVTPKPGMGEEEETPGEASDPDAPTVLRSLHLSDERLQLVAVVDLCELEGNIAVPVDYKKGDYPERGPWPADRVQMGAQALLLRAHGLTCEQAVLYYAGSRRRAFVDITPELEQEVLSARDTLLGLWSTGQLPPPLVDDARCPRCSLVGICLPDETRALRGEAEPDEVRRLVPARPETVPAHIQTQGARVNKKDDLLEVWTPGQGTERIRLLELESLNLYGAVQMTAQAQQALLQAHIPICHFSHGGWFYGITQGLSHNNVILRREQFRSADSPAACLELSRAFVRGKVQNHRTLLRRNLQPAPPAVLKDLARLIQRIHKADSLGTLLGLEGTAARVWFEHLPSLLRPPEPWPEALFEHRNRRPPRDPVNAMLSYGYGILVKELSVTAERTGLDCRLGFYHQPRNGRPSLALDLMEEFRPLVVDSVVISLINRGEVGPADFLRSGDAVSLNPQGRKKLLAAYERRMDTLITHPLFGYSVSYRRVLDVQTRLLGRWLLGEVPAYRPFVTR